MFLIRKKCWSFLEPSRQLFFEKKFWKFLVFKGRHFGCLKKNSSKANYFEGFPWKNCKICAKYAQNVQICASIKNPKYAQIYGQTHIYTPAFYPKKMQRNRIVHKKRKFGPGMWCTLRQISTLTQAQCNFLLFWKLEMELGQPQVNLQGDGIGTVGVVPAN